MDKGQALGMTLMIVCAVILSFASGGVSSEAVLAIKEEEAISGAWPVLCAIVSSFAFGFRSIFIKYYVEKGYNVYNLAV